MCYFLTATLPEGSDLTAVRAVRGPEGSRWRPITNSHVQAQLPAGWGYYELTGSACDCRSALVRSPTAAGKGMQLPRAAEHWTEAKRKRWLEQRGLVVDGREAAARGDAVAWLDYLKRVVVAAGRSPVGLLIHLYSGGVENERVTIARRSGIELRAASAAVLRALEPDVLYEFS